MKRSTYHKLAHLLLAAEKKKRKRARAKARAERHRVPRTAAKAVKVVKAAKAVKPTRKKMGLFRKIKLAVKTSALIVAAVMITTTTMKLVHFGQKVYGVIEKHKAAK